jgi:hypothetical protein
MAPDINVPPAATRIDGKGKFLIPGLCDMHAHHQGTGAGSLDLFVAKGVVGTRDMGGDADFILPLRERVKSGAILGPEIVTSRPILDDAPPDCSTGDTYSPKDCAPLFQKLAAKDIWETPTMEFFQTLPDVFSGAHA